MKHALIKSSALVQVADAPFDVHPDFFWTDCADDVTPETHEYLNGALVLKVPKLSSFAALKVIEIASYMNEREKMLARVTNISQRLEAAGDTVSATSCIDVSNSLLGLFTDAAVVAATDIVGLRAALKARYNQAAALASAQAKLEFKRYDK